MYLPNSFMNQCKFRFSSYVVVMDKQLSLEERQILNPFQKVPKFLVNLGNKLEPKTLNNSPRWLYLVTLQLDLVSWFCFWIDPTSWVESAIRMDNQKGLGSGCERGPSFASPQWSPERLPESLRWDSNPCPWKRHLSSWPIFGPFFKTFLS